MSKGQLSTNAKDQMSRRYSKNPKLFSHYITDRLSATYPSSSACEEWPAQIGIVQKKEEKSTLRMQERKKEGEEDIKLKSQLFLTRPLMRG